MTSADPSAPAFSQISSSGDVAYTLTAWTDNQGLLLPSSDGTQIITADPNVSSLKMNVTVAYRILLNFLDAPPAPTAACGGAPGSAPPDLRVGLVYISGQCYWNSAIIYAPAGTKLTLNAFPYPGFVFLGWSSNLGSPDAYLRTYVLNGPVTLVPRFSPAKRVRFETAPLGLQVFVDRTPVVTTTSDAPSVTCPGNQSLPILGPPTILPLCFGDFDFAPGSTHLVGAPTPQVDLVGKIWVFDSWGVGQGQNAAYTTDFITNSPDKVLVKFVRGAQASFVTTPPGLKLSVDGRTNWPAYNFVWAINTSHQVSAPAQQTDAGGRKFTFRGWSNSGDPVQTVTMDQAAVDSGFRMIAVYDGLSRVQVQTSPPGQKIQVDGADCQSPCTVDKANGSTVRVTVPLSIQLSDSARLDLASWSDGGAADHTYTINADTQTLTASYATSYRLSTGSDPANGAAFVLDPASPDMFYPADTSISVSVDPKPGFKFRRWGGDLSGTYSMGSIVMSGPRSITALMDRIPYIAPAGVKNAAGDTPSSTVAPGSLIAIFGESLAPDSVVGRTNPLAQTLDNVTVTVGDRLLPLVSVSAQQIVAQLPSDLTTGDYTLQVHSQGQPDVSGDFSVSRNAPGLFATATHQDGTPVTVDNPVAQGESINVFGTGFGPYLSPVIDGFYPFDPAPAVADPVDVLSGGQVLQADWSRAAAGKTGLVTMRIQIVDSTLQVRVNGVLSNAISIPMAANATPIP